MRYIQENKQREIAREKFHNFLSWLVATLVLKEPVVCHLSLLRERYRSLTSVFNGFRLYVLLGSIHFECFN